MPRRLSVALAALLAGLLLLAGTAQALDIRVIPAKLNAQGGPWDTGLGRIFKASPDERPDILICLEVVGAPPTCGPVCVDALECRATFARPALPVMLVVYDRDVTNDSDLILRMEIAPGKACNPCAIGAGLQQSRVFLAGTNACPVVTPSASGGAVQQALDLIRTRGNFSKRALGRFYGRQGTVQVCAGDPRPGYYNPEQDRIVISDTTAQTAGVDALLRIFFEELAHATQQAPAAKRPADPRRSAQAPWAAAYRDQLLEYEASGWIEAFMEVDYFRKQGLANPPFFAGGASAATDASVVQLLARIGRGTVSPARAARTIVPYVAKQTAGRGVGGQRLTYAQHYLEQGKTIWRCGQAGTARLSAHNGIWICR